MRVEIKLDTHSNIDWSAVNAITIALDENAAMDLLVQLADALTQALDG